MKAKPHPKPEGVNMVRDSSGDDRRVKMNVGERQLIYFLIIQHRPVNYFESGRGHPQDSGGILAGIIRTSSAE